MASLKITNNVFDKLRNYFKTDAKPIRFASHELQVESLPQVYDICIGARFDIGKDSAWMERQFKLMNLQFKHAYLSSVYANGYRLRYYATHNKKYLGITNAFMRERDKSLIEAYKNSKRFEDNIYRADNDQTCECEPSQIAVKEDLVTNFGLAIIIENFMLFNSLRFDTMEVGTNPTPPFGGDRALVAPVTSASIIDKGYAIPYGTEARHAAPFLASLATVDVKEVGVKDSVSGRLYSRSAFPSDRVIQHTQDFDVYSILHITQLKAVEA